MDFVRENLDGDLSLDTLAKEAHFSPHHFHRLFKAVAGETPTRFVQRARLERAAFLMEASPARKLDSIALEAGFGSHSAFSRVFKKHYLIAPRDWDRRSRLDVQHVTNDYERLVSEARAAGPEPTAVLVQQPARRLFYVRCNTPFIGEPLRSGYRELTDAMDRTQLNYRDLQLLGWSWDNPETTPLDRVHFNFGFSVPEGAEPPAGLGVQRFEAHQAVQVRCQGPMVRIAVAWEYLYAEWFLSSDQEPDEFPGIKVFHRRPDELGFEDWDLSCSIAVRRSVA